MNYAKFFKLSVVALALGTAFTSCDDNDGPTPNGPTASGMRFLVTATDSLKDLNGGVAMSFTFPDRDSAVVAFADYDLKINKVIVDSRAGSGASNRKGFRVGQLELDDSGDLFLFGGTAKHDDRQVVLRIKKGTTEFDKSFALDFGKLTGNHRIRRALPLAAGVYVVELYTEAGAQGISAFGGSSFGVLNLTSGTYTSVTGLPAGLSNGSLYIGRGDSYNGKFYLPISGATGLLSSPRNGAILKKVTPQRATVYTFGADGKASTFMTLKSGNIIKGFTIVK